MPFGERLDLVGDHRCAARAQCFEQVAVRNEAQALVPRVVARREVLLDFVIGSELVADHPEQPFFYELRVCPGLAVHPLLIFDVFPARDRIGPPLRKDIAQEIRDPILVGPRDDIRRRALQKRDVAGGPCERGHQRHRRRARADHDHALAGEIEVLLPFLRMQDRTLEPLASGEFGCVSPAVAVIARANQHEIARERDCLARVNFFNFDRPRRSFARPRRFLHAMPAADVPVDAVLARGFLHVFEDRGAVGDCFCVEPRLEAVAERVHVAVRAHAGIAKQVPRAADRVARFEQHERLSRALLAQVHRCADAGEACADDDDVEMFHEVYYRCLQMDDTARRRCPSC